MQTTDALGLKSIIRMGLALPALLFMNCQKKPDTPPAATLPLNQPLFGAIDPATCDRIRIEKRVGTQWKIDETIDPRAPKKTDSIRTQTLFRSLVTVVATDVRTVEPEEFTPQWILEVQCEQKWVYLIIGNDGPEGVSNWVKIQGRDEFYLLRGALLEIVRQIPNADFFKRHKLFDFQINQLVFGDSKNLIRNQGNEALFMALNQSRFLSQTSQSTDWTPIQANPLKRLTFYGAKTIKGQEKLDLRLFVQSGKLYAVESKQAFELYPETLRILNQLHGRSTVSNRND